MRAVQPIGERGSLRWIQRAVNERWPDLEAPIRARLGTGTTIDWRSPLREDEHAEYRDADFLRRLSLDHLASRLAAFWPESGPQWDALGIASGGKVLLVEAKSHIAEFCTPGSQASAEMSRRLITASLTRVAQALGSSRGAIWPELFYQYANRLAHLWLLRDSGVDAYLVLAGFLADAEMGGPATAETWHAAYRIANYALGLNARHPLAAHVIHVHPVVRP